MIDNRLGPLLARALGGQGSQDRGLIDGAGHPIDVAVPALLRDDARVAARSSLAAAAILRQVGDAFATERIPWLLWKGPALAMQAWGDASLRHFSDLDLAVLPRDRGRASDTLRALGWRARHGLGVAHQRVIERGSGAYAFERGEGEPLLELHWRFASARFPEVLRVDVAMARGVEVRVHGVECRTPRPSDALLLAALHGTKHGWSQAEEVATFDSLLRLADPGEVTGLGRATHRAGIARATDLAWALATVLAGEGHLADRDAPREREPVHAMARAALARMAAGDSAWRPTHRWTVSWIGRRRDRLRYWMHALLAPTLEEWKWVRLPAALVWLYPAVRVVRLAIRR